MTNQEQYNLCLRLKKELDVFFGNYVYKVFYSRQYRCFYVYDLYTGIERLLMSSLEDSILLAQIWNEGKYV
jgi:hypothetical protein